MTDSKTVDAGDQERSILRFIAKTAGGTFLLRLFYLACGFLTTLLLTHWIGSEGLGIYSFVISWIVLVAVLVKFGFEEYLVRELAAARSDGDTETVQRLWTFAPRFVLAGSAVACTIIAVCLPWFQFKNRLLGQAFYIGLIMVPLLSVTALYRGRFRACKQVSLSQVPEYLIRPTVITISVAAMLWLRVPGQPMLALLINVIATFLAMAFCMFAGSPQGKGAAVGCEANAATSGLNSHQRGNASPQAWISGAFPFVLIAGVSLISQRTDRLMLGALLDMRAVGLYSVAVQMAMVVNFTLIGLNQAIAPLVAERHASQRAADLQSALIQATNIASLGSLTIAGALVALGPIVLSVFGDEFSDSYLPMCILAGGQLLNVIAGPVGTVLSMSGHERFVGIGMATSVVLNFVLNYVLIPIYGVLGAAIATVTSIGVWNLMMVVYAKTDLGISTNFAAAIIPSKKQLK